MPDPSDQPAPQASPLPPALSSILEPGPPTPPPDFSLLSINKQLSELLVRLRRPPFDPADLDQYIRILISQRRSVVQIVELQGRKPKGGGRAPRPTKAAAPALNQEDLEDLLRKLNE